MNYKNFVEDNQKGSSIDEGALTNKKSNMEKLAEFRAKIKNKIASIPLSRTNWLFMIFFVLLMLLIVIIWKMAGPIIRRP